MTVTVGAGGIRGKTFLPDVSSTTSTAGIGGGYQPPGQGHRRCVGLVGQKTGLERIALYDAEVTVDIFYCPHS